MSITLIKVVVSVILQRVDGAESQCIKLMNLFIEMMFGNHRYDIECTKVN